MKVREVVEKYDSKSIIVTKQSDGKSRSFRTKPEALEEFGNCAVVDYKVTATVLAIRV